MAQATTYGGIWENDMNNKGVDFSNLIAERLPPPGTTPWRYANGRPKFDFGTGFPDPDSFPEEGLL